MTSQTIGSERPGPTYYANTSYLPRELRGEPAIGEMCHHGRALDGEGCPACDIEESGNYSMPTMISTRKINETRASVRTFEPLTDDELSEIIYGYVTAATWTDLLRLPECPDCGEPMEWKPSGWYVHVGLPREGCARFYDEIDSETGSDPYKYGPDDLDPDSLARVREIVSSFVGVPDHWSFATTADIRLYEEIVGGGYDHANGRDYSALEKIGHTLYLTASGSGVAFTDDEWSERDDMSADRRALNGLLRRLERASGGHGLDAVMMCADGSIQVQG